jgi:hypothetical protein
MEGDSLYSVKWYKGRREFYRYSPKENPAMKTFPIAGVHVVVSFSCILNAIFTVFNDEHFSAFIIQRESINPHQCLANYIRKVLM